MTGVSAKDAYGKDISGKIEVYQERCSGDSLPCYPDENITWDNHTIGTTKFYYQVLDDYGGFQEVTRTITVNRVYVYSRGNYYESFTGGWQQWFYTSDITDYYTLYNAHTIYTPNMGLHATVRNSSNRNDRNVVSIITKNKIDITNYNKLCIYYNAENVETNVNIFACSNNQTQNIDLRDVDYYADVVENGEGLTQCIALDFDTMSCYPALASWSKDTGSGTTSYFTTIEMWFE